MEDYKYFKIIKEKIPVLGMGTWRIGGGMTADHSRDKEWAKVLRRGIELGLKLIDTAEIYGAGHSEEIVGEAIKGYPRDELFIVSKVWPAHADREGVFKAVKGSMKRLGTYIDLYLLHWPADVPICETMRTMEELVEKGYVRYIGLSNFEVSGIEEARSCLSKVDIAAVQNKHNLLYRKYEKDVIPYCEKEGMMFMSYTPIAKGELASNEFLADIGRKYGKTAVQVALNWLICIPPVIPIPKAGRIDHLEENTGAMEWRLSKEDWKAIDEKFKQYK